MNQQSKNILYLEDNPITLKTLATGLERKGFRVFKASTLEAAKVVLDTQWIHMAIVDLGLDPNDNSGQNHGGFNLIEDEAYAIIPKAILTGHDDDVPTMQRAWPQSDGKPSAVAFISKNEANHRERITELFDTHVKVNWELQIDWLARTESSISRLTSQITDDQAYFIQWMEEVESLLRQLFTDEMQITIGRTLLYHAGVAWLEVGAWSPTGSQNSYVVACGQRDNLNHQIERYETYAPKANASGNLQIIKESETLRFKAVCYECAGCPISKMMSLERLYTRYPYENILEIIEVLYGKTLAAWHIQERETVQISSLKKLSIEWGLRYEDTKLLKDEDLLLHNVWQAKVEDLCSQAISVIGVPRVSYADKKLTIHRAKDTEEFSFCQGGTTMNTKCQKGIILGNVRIDNLLVDIDMNGVWPIDYSRIQKGPILRDFVSLEASLKTELLLMMSMEEWLDLEEKLLNVESLENPIEVAGLSLEAQKILQMIGQIRRQAQVTAGSDLHSYLASLYLHAIGQLENYNPDKKYLDHSIQFFLQHLFSAAIVSQHLGIPKQFEINVKERFVIVEGRQQKLTGTEAKILQYMSERVGQTCTYDELLLHLDGRIEDGASRKRFGIPRLNQSIRRLRQRVEPDYDNPRYIQTEPSVGYKLAFLSPLAEIDEDAPSPPSQPNRKI